MANIFAPLVRQFRGVPVLIGSGPISGPVSYMHLNLNDEGAIHCSSETIAYFGDGLPFDVNGRMVVQDAPVVYWDQDVPFTANGSVSIQEEQGSYIDQGVPFTERGSLSTFTESIIVPGEYFQYYNTDPGSPEVALPLELQNNTNFAWQVVFIAKTDLNALPGGDIDTWRISEDGTTNHAIQGVLSTDQAGPETWPRVDNVVTGPLSWAASGHVQGDVLDLRGALVSGEGHEGWLDQADKKTSATDALNGVIKQLNFYGTEARLLAWRIVVPAPDDATILAWPTYGAPAPVWSTMPSRFNFLYELPQTFDTSPYVTTSITSWALVSPPAGFSIDSSGVVEAAVGAADAVHNLTVRATNTDFQSADGALEWELDTGNVPTWDPIPTQSHRVNELPKTLDVKPYANSDSGPILSYALIAPPPGFSMLDGVVTASAGTAVASYSLTVRATNGVGASDTTFTWDILEELVVPQWSTIPNQNNRPSELPQDLNTALYVTTNSGPLSNWQLTPATPGFSIDSSGLMTANAGLAIADYNLAVTVSNDQGPATSASFEWKIADPLPPQWSTVPAQTTREDALPAMLDMKTYVSSNDGPLTGWALIAPPAGFSIDGTGVITVAGGTAVGIYPITVEVTNNSGTTQSNEFNWEIELFYLPPQWTTIPDQSHFDVDLPQNLNVVPYVTSNSGSLTGWTLVTPPAGFTISASGVITCAAGTALAQHSITVEVSNDEGPAQSAPFTWTVADVPEPPVWSTVPDQSTREDNLPTSLNMKGYVTTNSGQLRNWSILAPPAGFSINTAGLVSVQAGVTPSIYSLTVRVENDEGTADSNTFSWDIVAFFLPPQWSPIPDQSTQEQLLPVILDVRPYVTSNHGDLVGWDIVPAVGGFTIDSAGIITVAEGRAVGSYSITVRVSNDSGTTDSAAFDWDILIAPEAPAWQTIPNRQDRENTLPQDYDVSGYASSNASSGPLTGWTLVSPPSGFAINGAGVITAAAGTSVAIHSLTVRVSNDIGSSDTSFTWEIQEELLVPQWDTIPNQSDRENTLPQLLDANAFVTSNAGSLILWRLAKQATGFSIDSSGVVTAAPGTALGDYTLQVGVTNSIGEALSNDFQWEILEELLPPQWQTIPNRQDNDTDLPQDYDVHTYVTSNSGPLTGWNLKSPPAGFTVDSSGVITAATGTNEVVHNLTIAVSNDEGETQTSFTWEIVKTASPEYYHEFNADPGIVTTVRASNATFWDKDRIFRTVGPNEPYYEGCGWSGSQFTPDAGFVGMVVEAPSTNHYLHSNDLTQSAWLVSSNWTVNNATQITIASSGRREAAQNIDPLNTPYVLSTTVQRISGSLNDFLYRAKSESGGQLSYRFSITNTKEWQWDSASITPQTLAGMGTPLFNGSSGSFTQECAQAEDEGWINPTSWIITSGAKGSRARSQVEFRPAGLGHPGSDYQIDFCGQIKFYCYQESGSNFIGGAAGWPGIIGGIVGASPWHYWIIGITEQSRIFFAYDVGGGWVQLDIPTTLTFSYTGFLVDVRWRWSSTTGLKVWLYSSQGNNTATNAGATTGLSQPVDYFTLGNGTFGSGGDDRGNFFVIKSMRIRNDIVSDATIEGWT